MELIAMQTHRSTLLYHVCMWEPNWLRGGYLVLIVLIVIAKYNWAFHNPHHQSSTLPDRKAETSGRLQYLQLSVRPWQLPQHNWIMLVYSSGSQLIQNVHQCAQQTDHVNVTCSGEMQLDCHPDFFQILLCGVCTSRCTTTKYITCTLEWNGFNSFEWLTIMMQWGGGGLGVSYVFIVPHILEWMVMV